MKCVKCEGKIGGIKKVLIDCWDGTVDGSLVKRKKEKGKESREEGEKRGQGGGRGVGQGADRLLPPGPRMVPGSFKK